MPSPLNILFVSSEVHPLVKTGGLADVASALPRALGALGHQVRVVLPHYKTLNKKPARLKKLTKTFSVPVGTEDHQAEIYKGKLDEKVPVFTIDHPTYFNRDQLYGEAGKPYPDNASRFVFFCRSVLEYCKTYNFSPDIIHCNDWQTGLIPVYLKTLYENDSVFSKTRTVFSIHNLGYQGNFWHLDLPLSNLPWELFTPEGVEFFGQFSFMKAGLVYADQLTTVSKNYAKEILNPEFGFGMDGVLRSRKKHLAGITNGIDINEWDPASDSLIAAPFNSRSFKGKMDCKRELIKKFSLNIKPKEPLACMVTRLTTQKGIDHIVNHFENLTAPGKGLVILGSGEDSYESFFRNQNNDRFGCLIGYDETTAHQIIAGSDFLLMPSQYEPCGLTQLQAMRYGTIPIVTRVGGLKNTVKQYQLKSKAGWGFLMNPHTKDSLRKSLHKAYTLYDQASHLSSMRKNAMRVDSSWKSAAKKYATLYRNTLKPR